MCVCRRSVEVTGEESESGKKCNILDVVFEGAMGPRVGHGGALDVGRVWTRRRNFRSKRGAGTDGRSVHGR